ncbi:hypothetical protein K0M31_019755 [Melipona bicolor]|uniref:Uncharacterized protein n=1 Tax=Melipona bicolor TaxID=60889 RepID=A0AA40G2Z5_9HYME|nr:hypothetical protein K0M31_019755 [Melipona bicolor]
MERLRMGLRGVNVSVAVRQPSEGVIREFLQHQPSFLSVLWKNPSTRVTNVAGPSSKAQGPRKHWSRITLVNNYSQLTVWSRRTWTRSGYAIGGHENTDQPRRLKDGRNWQVRGVVFGRAKRNGFQGFLAWQGPVSVRTTTARANGTALSAWRVKSTAPLCPRRLNWFGSPPRGFGLVG